MPPAVPNRSNPLDSTLIDRLSELPRPEWVRATHVRRLVAAALAVAAVLTAVRGDPDSDRVAVVVAAHDLQPGIVLTAHDLELSQRAAGAVPEGAETTVESVTGRILAGPTRAGEPLTDVRFLGPRLADAATGIQDARIVPLRLADPGVAGLLRAGDRVDVLTVAADAPPTTAQNPSAAILATGAVVVLVTTPKSDRNQRERVVMIALPKNAATRVAAASLTDAMTVTFQ